MLLLFTVLFGKPQSIPGCRCHSSFDEKPLRIYKGKTVRIVVGFSAGGGYDVYSRLMGPIL
jgi:hypothetical protein